MSDKPKSPEPIELKPFVCPACKRKIETGWFLANPDGSFTCVECSNADKPKSPVEEAAREDTNKRYWGDDKRLVEVKDPEKEVRFIAGAKWLAGELFQKSYNSSERGESYVVDIEELKRLMGEE